MGYKYKLKNFLNKRNSLRDFLKKLAIESGIKFDTKEKNWKKIKKDISPILNGKICDDLFHELAEQLVKEGHYKFNENTENDLLNDWEKFKSFRSDKKYISSTKRSGMKILEYFMPNFYDIKDSKGSSFNDKWSNVDNLVKILRWNVNSHSTPYISELKRGIYLCCSQAKNTMYRPTIAKMIVDEYAENKQVLDPCVGWGGRMIGTVAAGCHYTGFEPNTETFNNLKKIVDFLSISDKVTLYNDVAENIHKYDSIKDVSLILTSPPYYNLEIYCDEKTQSYKPNQTYEEWKNDFLKNIIEQCISKGTGNVFSVWDVHNFGKYKLIEDVKNIHESIGFKEIDRYCVSSVLRPFHRYKTFNFFGHKTTIELTGENLKTSDVSVCFSKNPKEEIYEKFFNFNS